jgi:L-ribulose-5-phosphate 3-epimerase
MGLKIGVMIESFGLGVKEGIKKAAEIGADGFQIYTTSGEMDPDNLSQSGRKEFVRMVESLGLKVSALCGDLGHGFADENGLEQRVAKSKKILDLALDLKTDVVTTHIGVVPDDDQSKTWKIMHAAVKELADYGDKIGACFATETGPETTVLLKKFLDSLKSRGVRANYDPANLVMCVCDDPVKGVHTLKDYIVHTHAKDGINLGPGKWKEVPLGEGGVDFPKYIAALKDIGYDGFLTIERETGSDPVSDIVKAKKFLETLV